MKFASAILMLTALGIASFAIFGVAAMSHDGGHAGWCPVVVTAGDCPTAANALAAVSFHLDGMREFLTATVADASAGFLLALFGIFALLFTLIRSVPDWRSARELGALPRAAREPLSSRESHLIRWLAFHEN